MNGTIVEYKTFAVHDGPGIRTTVFLKGCPLKCQWCHNPEAISPKPQLSFKANRCVMCGECAKVCRAHEFLGGRHTVNRNVCIACGRCAEACPTGALALIGRSVSAREVADELALDRDYYEITGGGATISGGEPLSQSAFCAEILNLLKARGISTAVDTSGEADSERFFEVMPYTDLFLYDIKHIDPEMHRRATGRGNERILKNLRLIGEAGAKIEIRIPLIPGFNDGAECLAGIRDYLRGARGIARVRVLPYHAMARAKYETLGMTSALTNVQPPSREALAAAEKYFADWRER